MFINLKAVIDYTGLNILQVYELPIMEYLNYLAYCKAQRQRDNAEIKKRNDKIKRQHKHKK